MKVTTKNGNEYEIIVDKKYSVKVNGELKSLSCTYTGLEEKWMEDKLEQMER